MRYRCIKTLLTICFAQAIYLLMPDISFGQSLDEYLITAGNNNPTLKAEFTKYLASLEEVPQITALPDPTISFGYFTSPIETRVGPQQSRIGLNQVIPWFGTLSAKGDLATMKAKSQFEVFEEARNKLFFRVKQQWYKLYLLHQSINILKENLDILNSLENLTIQRYETGQVRLVDVLRIQIEKEDLEVQLELLKGQLKTDEARFNEFLYRDKNLSVDVVDTLATRPFSINEAELSQRILSRNPKLEQLNYQSASAQHAIRVAQKSGNPDFGVGFDYIFHGERTDLDPAGNGDDAFLINVRIKIPLWRTKYNAQVRQEELNYRSIQDRILAFEKSLSTDLKRALQDLRDAEYRFKLYEEAQIQRTRYAIDILMEEYTSSSTNFEELLRLQQKLLNFQLAREETIVDQNIAIAYLDYLSGSDNIIPHQPSQKN